MMLLLPGMDGSGALWGPLVAELGGVEVERWRYPTNVGRYDELLDGIPRIEAPTIVVAESFGGPLAIRLAARDRGVRELVLIASFARGPRLARWTGALAALTPHPPPRYAVRAALLGGPHPIEDALLAAIAAVEPAAMRTRIREVARVDVRRELASLRIPVTWIHATRDRLLGPPTPSSIPIDGPHLLAQTRPREIAAILRRTSDPPPTS